MRIYPPFLAFRLPRRRGFIQRKADFKVIVIDHQADCSLPSLASDPIEEVLQHGHLMFDQ
jgi:hypothetical protein